MLDEKQMNENIISLLGIEKLPEEQKLLLLHKMSSLLQKRIAARVLEKLDAEDQQAFVNYAGKEEGRVKAILEKKKINVVALVQEEVLKLREEMKSVVDELHV
jgi:Mg/Co/Ni transporter MgtE